MAQAVVTVRESKTSQQDFEMRFLEANQRRGDGGMGLECANQSAAKL
jgi:hypothetical protein